MDSAETIYMIMIVLERPILSDSPAEAHATYCVGQRDDADKECRLHGGQFEHDLADR